MLLLDSAGGFYFQKLKLKRLYSKSEMTYTITQFKKCPPTPLLLKDLQLQENSFSFQLRSKHNSYCLVTNLAIVYFDMFVELSLVGVESKFLVNFQIIIYTKSWRRGLDRNRCI